MANRTSWDHWALWEELLWVVSCDDRAALQDDVRAMRARLDAPISLPVEESALSAPERQRRALNSESRRG